MSASPFVHCLLDINTVSQARVRTNPGFAKQEGTDGKAIGLEPEAIGPIFWAGGACRWPVEAAFGFMKQQSKRAVFALLDCLRYSSYSSGRRCSLHSKEYCFTAYVVTGYSKSIPSNASLTNRMFS